MALQPLGNYLLLKPVEAVTTSASGLYLPETAKDAPDEGVIVAIAADAGDEVQMGDKVIYKKFAGEEVTVDGEKYRLVQVDDLLAKYVSAGTIPE